MQGRIFYQPLDTSRGFLPVSDPVIKLPDVLPGLEEPKLNKKLNAIVERLPILLAEKKLGAEVDALDKEFLTERIQLESHHVMQKQAAILFLASIAQAYVFENPEAKRKEVPAVISRSLYRQSYLKQSRPTLTYNDYILHNWQRIDADKPITLDNIKPIITFTNTADEAWFIKIHVVIEAECAGVINAAHRLAQALQNKSIANDVIMKELNNITKGVYAAIDLMHQMKNGCQPAVFWEQLRPYLSGWNTVEGWDNGKKGVALTGINNGDVDPYSYSGPSGAQSSIVPALDALLNIKHEINGMFEYLNNFKSYMPKPHCKFILQLEESKIRRYIKASQDEALCEAYDGTVEALWKFRGAHMALVHAYIYKPAEKAGIDRKHITGTGGSPIEFYLSKRYGATKQHQLKQSTI